MPQTGPRTDAGKARSRVNAVKHGMRAVNPIVRPIESKEDWERHLEGIIESLDPEGYLERELAARVAVLLWRLRRVSLYESEQIALSVDDVPETAASIADHQESSTGRKIKEVISHELIDKMIGARMFPVYSADSIMRYEAHLHRQSMQTLHELEAIQARRRGEHTPLARLDITGSPSVTPAPRPRSFDTSG